MACPFEGHRSLRVCRTAAARTPAGSLEQVRNEAYQAALQRMHQQQTAVHEQQASNYIEKFAEGKPYWPQIENQVLYHILALKGTNPEMDYRELLQTAHDRALSEQRDLDPRAKAKAQEELSERENARRTKPVGSPVSTCAATERAQPRCVVARSSRRSKRSTTAFTRTDNSNASI